MAQAGGPYPRRWPVRDFQGCEPGRYASRRVGSWGVLGSTDDEVSKWLTLGRDTRDKDAPITHSKVFLKPSEAFTELEPQACSSGEGAVGLVLHKLLG